MRKTPFVSIIIPVYNDTLRLKQCIEALEKQTYPKECLEIIVIDNGSTNNLQQDIQHYPGVSILKESCPGSYVARNKGIAFAKGTIIAFTDSDCIPSVKWLEAGVKRLVLDNHGIIGGAIEFFFRDSKPNTVEFYDSLFFLQQERYVEEIKIATTANLFTLKKMFDKVGLFNGNLKSGADGEWCRRVTDSGYTIAYSMEAVVKHPARYKVKELYKKIRRVTGGKFTRDINFDESFLSFWKKYFKEAVHGSRRILKLKYLDWDKRFSLLIFEFSIQVVRMIELIKLRYGKKPERE